jgi:hypothetical protein
MSIAADGKNVYYFVRDNWQGSGYRLYVSDDPAGALSCQVDGEINGKVYDTTADAVSDCEYRFKATPELDTDGDNDVTEDQKVLRDGPQEDDIVTNDFNTFYQYGRPVLTVDPDADWKAEIQKYMDGQQFWPNVWRQDDHGGCEVVNAFG